ncbi:MAG: GatB/YqeY domain-containing protein [candidate division Zixibacteria bacterium]|nr:GatB/YqeY domain-containing protein [candidate division Zixibacteria bacterium]
MSLKERIDQDMRMAQKSGEKLKLSLTRLLKSDIRYKEIDKGKELSDEEVLEVLTSAAKKHRDSIEQFRKGGREDLVKQEEDELKLILGYMPEQLNAEELGKLVEEAITEVGAEGEKDMGKVMKVLMPKVKGKADGKAVSLLVSSRLKSAQRESTPDDPS